VSESYKLVRPFWGRLVCVGLVSLGCDAKNSQGEANIGAPAELNPAALNMPSDKDCCMGKNDCKGKGGCAVPESNSCAGKNDCKGKGGCNMHCSKK
jgi:hypothetical protein